jgi:hypothetical protein
VLLIRRGKDESWLLQTNVHNCCDILLGMIREAPVKYMEDCEVMASSHTNLQETLETWIRILDEGLELMFLHLFYMKFLTRCHTKEYSPNCQIMG